MNKELALGGLLILAWAAGKEGEAWRWPEPRVAGLHSPWLSDMPIWMVPADHQGNCFCCQDTAGLEQAAGN